MDVSAAMSTVNDIYDIPRAGKRDENASNTIFNLWHVQGMLLKVLNIEPSQLEKANTPFLRSSMEIARVDTALEYY